MAWNQIFLPLGKNKSFGAKGCKGSLVALNGRSCIYAAIRLHMYYYLCYKFWKSSVFLAKFIIPAKDPLFVACVLHSLILLTYFNYQIHQLEIKVIYHKSKGNFVLPKGKWVIWRAVMHLGLKSAHFIIN